MNVPARTAPRRELPSGDRFKVPGVLVRRLAELGVPAAEVLRQAGLPPALFQQEKITVSTDQLFSLWRALADVSGDPALGLRIGFEERIERYDPICIAALYARSQRDAIERMARYKQLTCPEEVRILDEGRDCAVTLKWLLAREAEPPLLLDMCFSAIAIVGQRGTEGVVKPVRIEFQRPERHRDIYESHFGCEVVFRAARNALVYRGSDLDRPFLTHNAELSGLLAPQLEAELQQHLAQRSVSGRVKTTLKRLLAGQRPSMSEVARGLGMSTRTLQRRLAEENATFQQLLEQSRRELAQHYLVHASLELTETAYLLGYENSTSFFRAFQQWEGSSPGRWRTERLNGQPAMA